MVVLACLFDPEQDVLYSVKWYKDDVEFFRHLPNDSPPNQFFDIGDVEVDVSIECSVFLQVIFITEGILIWFSEMRI